MKTKLQLLTIMLTLLLVTLACGQFEVGVEEPTASPEPTNIPAPVETNGNNTVRDEPQKPDYSEYWQSVEDPRTGLKFALPCYWSSDFPLAELDPTGLGSESFENFTEQFITSLGPKRAPLRSGMLT